MDRPSPRTAAFSLIETMTVIVIVGIAVGGVGFGLGLVTRTQMKSACGKILSAARFAYNRAVVRGTTVRLVFEIGSGEFSLQEAHGRIVLARANDERAQEDAEAEDADDNRSGDVDPWKAAESRLQDVFKPSLGSSSFGPLGHLEGGGSKRYSQVPLGRGVRFGKLMVPHEPTPLESGKGAIYFFANGQTEHAVVQLQDTSENVYTVEIHPLTGRGTVYDRAYEPEVLLDDPDAPEATEVEMPL